MYGKCPRESGSPDTLNHIWPQQFEKGAGGGQMQPLANYRGPFICFYIDPQNNVEVPRVHYPISFGQSVKNPLKYKTWDL